MSRMAANRPVVLWKTVAPRVERDPDAAQPGCRAHPSHPYYDDPIADLKSQEINEVQKEKGDVVKDAPIREGLEFVGPEPLMMTNDCRCPRFINRKNVGHSDIIRGDGNEGQSKGQVERRTNAEGEESVS